MGYNIEPDSRYTSKSYKWDDFIVFYEDSDIGFPEKANYSTAAMLFDIGVYISSVDSSIDKEELDTVETFVKDNFCFTKGEKIRIGKRRILAFVRAIKGKGVAKKLAERLKISDLKKVGNYLFMVAAADGIIDNSELKAIKNIFADFGIGEELLYTILEEYRLNTKIEESTKIKKGSGNKKEGSKIPSPQKQVKQYIDIDKEVLQTILKDTEEVKGILSQVFTDEEKEEIKQPTQIENDTSLTTDISNFLNIILEKEQWERDELRQLALKNKIMLGTAIEKINYWCEEENGDYLIFEEQGKYLIERNILKEHI